MTLRVTAVREDVSVGVVRDADLRALSFAAFSEFSRRRASTVGFVSISEPGIMRDTAPTAIMGSAVSATQKPSLTPFIILEDDYITKMSRKKAESIY